MTAAARPAPALVGVKVAEGARAAVPEARQALVTPPRTAAPPVAVATSPLVAALACLAVFVFVATTGTSGRPVPSRAFLEYDLADYSGWLRRRVADEPGRWDEIKTCLAATAPVCSELNQTYAAPQDFFAAWLSPMQSGCCKPPTRCGYTYVSATNWISPIDGAADPDCAAWSNDQDRLCYSCDSCKAGLLQNLRREWRRADVVLAGTVVALLAVYAMGCYAFRTARTDELFRRYRQGYT